MPSRPDAPPVTRGVLLRSTIFALAVALGAVAVWLIVTSTSQKGIELGVLAGLWGLLLGTFSMYTSRRVPQSAESRDELRDSSAERGVGTEVELRAASSVERAEDADARRAHELRLEAMVRHEIHEAVGREVGELQAEIASLRGELLEKFGGQLRLERIETTRVIGSDLEALQHEVRQLKVASHPEPRRELAEFARSRAGEPSPLREVVESVLQPAAPPAADSPPPVAPPIGHHAARPGPSPASVAPSAEQPAAVAQPISAPEGTGARDEFAALPRLKPFTDFELDPIEVPAPDPSYLGRRRNSEDHEPETSRRSRHAAAPVARRHRVPDDDDSASRADGDVSESADPLARLSPRDSVR